MIVEIYAYIAPLCTLLNHSSSYLPYPTILPLQKNRICTNFTKGLESLGEQLLKMLPYVATPLERTNRQVEICSLRVYIHSALNFYRKTDDVDSDMEEMDTEDTSGTAAASAGDGDAPGAQPYTLRQLLVATDLRRPLFIAAMLQVIQQFSGINAVSSVYVNVYTPCATHSHGGLQQCGNDDGATQRKSPKFDPSPHQNHLTKIGMREITPCTAPDVV